MSERLIAWVLAATFPSTPKVPGLDQLDPKPLLRGVLADGTLTLKLGLYGSVAAFVLSPLITVGWPLPAFLLPRAVLDRHAYNMGSHRLYLLRQAMLMIKTIGGGIWGALPEARTAVGLPAYGDDPGTWRGDLTVIADLAPEPDAGANTNAPDSASSREAS